MSQKGRSQRAAPRCCGFGPCISRAHRRDVWQWRFDVGPPSWLQLDRWTAAVLPDFASLRTFSRCGPVARRAQAKSAGVTSSIRHEGHNLILHQSNLAQTRPTKLEKFEHFHISPKTSLVPLAVLFSSFLRYLPWVAGAPREALHSPVMTTTQQAFGDAALPTSEAIGCERLVPPQKRPVNPPPRPLECLD